MPTLEWPLLYYVLCETKMSPFQISYIFINFIAHVNYQEFYAEKQSCFLKSWIRQVAMGTIKVVNGGISIISGFQYRQFYINRMFNWNRRLTKHSSSSVALANCIRIGASIKLAEPRSQDKTESLELDLGLSIYKNSWFIFVLIMV